MTASAFDATFEHREQLIDAAIDEFVEKGYDRASLNTILARSGMSKGQAYHHFGSKQGLYLALVGWALECKSAWLSEHPQPTPDDFFDVVRAQVLAGVTFTRSNPQVQRLMRSLQAERGRPIHDALVARYGFDPHSAVATLVRHHQRRGGLRRDLDESLVVDFVLASLNHLDEMVDLTQPDGLEDRLDALLGLLRTGLRPWQAD